MRIFFNQEWNFTIAYPTDWRIIYENEPAGSCFTGSSNGDRPGR
jgi:hypothetical protein